MKVMVIGTGGREHALAWKLSQSPQVSEVYAAPGSVGMTDVASVVPSTKPLDYVELARELGIDLTVAGPETVLAEGLADQFKAAGLDFFGPSKAAARIEGSKGFAKDLMKKYHVPTAAYETFSDEENALAYLRKQTRWPQVIKADGLAAGKGVIIAETLSQAEEAIHGMMEGLSFGGAGRTVVIEEFMEGEEASVLCFCDGTTVVPMISSQDHKRVGDGDKGLNTGGMGAYAPAPVMTDSLMQRVRKEILEPIVKGMKQEGYPFQGCLYAGLMITEEGPKVVEFNCRFGDPETEAVLPLLDGDLFQIMMDCVHGTLKEDEVRWKPGYAVDVVMATKGYPGSHTSGDVITGLKEAAEAGCHVFHAGTRLEGDHYVTSGGRVLNVVAVAPTLEEARNKAYEGVSRIHWEGVQFRHDIAMKGLRHLKK
jgi:phosphoribosylamine--glycine ligase